MTPNLPRSAAAPLLVTRPQAQAERFAADFAARFGRQTQVVISPLVRVRHLPLAVRPDRYAGLLFTSENGVAAFAAQVADRHWPVWCVGARTTARARAAGFTATSADGDAAALLALLRQTAPPEPLLHLCGEHTVGDLANALNSAGIETFSAPIYAQDALALSPDARALLQGRKPVLVPLFSPRTAALFQTGITGPVCPLLIAALSQAVADVVTLPRLACEVATRPDGPAMLGALGKLIEVGAAA